MKFKVYQRSMDECTSNINDRPLAD